MNAINSTCKQPVTQLGKGFAAAAIKMLEQSAKPLPVTKKKDSEGRPKKHPAIKGWPLVEIDESFVESQDYSAGICFRADGLQAIDCDITDGSLSESIESYIREKIGDQGRFYYRTADASRPKFLICCRIEGIRQKLVSHKYECGQIEIFAGHKSQFLMAGRHPKGGWYQCEPELGSIPPDQIITLSAEDIYEVIDLFESEAEKRGFEKLTKEGSAQDYKGASGLRSSYGTAQGVFNRMITIDVLISWLEGEGWTVVKEEIFNHQPSYFLKHPTSTNDHSARLYYGAENGNVILYNFSSSVLDGQQKAFSAFELLKVLKFGGDPGKTFRHLEEEYGIENPLSGRDNVNGLVEELENIIGQQVSDDLIQQLADLKLSRDQVKTVLNNHDISFEEAQLTAVSLDSPVPQKTNDLTKVINVGLQNRLIVDQNGEPYLVPEGQNRAIPMDHISDYLLTQVRKNLGMFVRSSVADDAVKHLASIAREEGERVIVAKRTHYDPDTRTIYVDIGDESNTIIVITPDGWTESNCDTPIVFQHGGKKYGALPLPNGQDLEDVTKLFDLIHVDSDSKEVLILASILQTFLGGGFITFFHGPAGSSKTTAARILKGFIDPTINLRQEAVGADMTPDDRKLLFESQHAPLIDNITDKTFESMRSDLCILSTGGAIPRRRLYSNNTLVDVKIKCSPIITGITCSSKHEDVLDRLLSVAFDPIPDSQKKDVNAVWDQYETDGPIIMAGIFNMLAAALKQEV